MKWMNLCLSRGLPLTGLFIVVMGGLLPVNDRMDGGQRIGQDCDGPENVLIVLGIGVVLALSSFLISVFRNGLNQSARDKFLLGAILLTALAAGLKLPEIVNEYKYNSSDSTCSSD